MSNFYQYADYDTLPEDQKVIWWFDEYITYDLVFSHAIQHNYVFLIQRYTLYNHAWADDYSGLLFDLFSQTPFLYHQGNNMFTDATITIDNIAEGETVVVTYLERGGRNNIRDYLFMEYPPSIPLNGGNSMYFEKTHRFFTAKDNGLTLDVTIAKYSAVITGSGVTLTGDAVLYANRAGWLIEEIPPAVVTVPQRSATFELIWVSSTWRPGEPVLGSLYDLGEGFNNSGEYTNSYLTWVKTEERESFVEVDISDVLFIGTHLIYARPPDSLFNGLFTSQKAGVGSNRSAGNSGYFLFDILRVIESNFLISSLFTGSLSDSIPSRPDFYYEQVTRHPHISIARQWTISNNGTQASYTDSITTHTIVDNAIKLYSNPYYSHDQAEAMFQQLLLQTALIYPSNSNFREILLVNDEGQPVDEDGNVTTNPDEYVFDINEDYIEEYVMGSELMIQEIHACLGAGEFAYYMDGGNPQPYRMNMARLLQTFARAYGVAFKPDGSILSVRERKAIPYDQNGANIPDGWTRGQFADNIGGGGTGQTGGSAGEERTGIAYQNRCNVYENLDDDNKGNDILQNGDIILCENFLQLFESYLEDLDKGLNWQEMGSGLLPNADGTSYTTFEGMGTLLAEMAYTLSALSNNIQQTHVLTLKNNAVIMEVLKGLGLPVGVGTLPLSVGGGNGAGGENTATLTFPQLSANSVSLHKRIMDVLATLSVVTGGILKTEDTLTGGTP